MDISLILMTGIFMSDKKSGYETMGIFNSSSLVVQYRHQKLAKAHSHPQ